MVQNTISIIIILNEMLNISFIFRYSRRFKAQEQGMAAAQSLPAPIQAPHSLQSGSVLVKTVTFWFLSGFCSYLFCLVSLVSSVCLAWCSVIFLHSCSLVTSWCLCLLVISVRTLRTVSVSRFGYWRSFSKSSFPTRFLIFAATSFT